MNDHPPAEERHRTLRCDGIGGVVVMQLPGHKKQSGGKGGRDGNGLAGDQKLVPAPVDDPLLAPDIKRQGLAQNDGVRHPDPRNRPL